VPAARNRNRERLAARLRAVRAAAGFSGNALASRLGWPQSRVSKLETGKQLPNDEQLAQWVEATAAAGDIVGELSALLAAARVEYASWRGVERVAGGLAARQAELARWEASATRIAEYQPAMIPGLVQTAAYARELLSLPPGPAGTGPLEPPEVEALVAERMHRQEIRYEPDRSVQIVVGEAALWAPPVAVGTLRAQLGKLETVAGLPTVELSVIPLQAPMPAMPLAGFRLYDDTLVVIETISGEQQLEDSEEVATYTAVLDALRSAAATGDQAVDVIRRVTRGLTRA